MPQLPDAPEVKVRTPLVTPLPPIVSPSATAGSATVRSSFHAAVSVAVSVEDVAPPTAS